MSKSFRTYFFSKIVDLIFLDILLSKTLCLKIFRHSFFKYFIIILFYLENIDLNYSNLPILIIEILES